MIIRNLVSFDIAVNVLVLLFFSKPPYSLISTHTLRIFPLTNPLLNPKGII